MKLEGAVALVTGGASGLGEATVRRLADDGVRVGIIDLPGSGGEALAAELGPSVRFYPGDVTSEDDVSAALDDAGALGDLRLIVTCAGVGTSGRILGHDGPLPLDDFRRVVEINLVGTFNVLRLAAERMSTLELLDGERGVIVCTASIAAFEGQIGQAAYAASKAGVVGLTLTAARDLANNEIRVVTVAPGGFETPMVAGLPENARAAIAEQVPHPARLGRPAEFAALIAHVVDNTMINGEVIRLDGAFRMPPRSF